MTIDYSKDLDSALKNLGSFVKHELVISSEERTLNNSDSMLERYGDAKFEIVRLINEKYETDFDLTRWLRFDKTDEVSYFINETGSNALSYSSHKIPFRFLLWLGESGFIIGVEQMSGFNAQRIDSEKLKENKGAAFDFYRSCSGVVFFDDARDARVVYFVNLFKTD